MLVSIADVQTWLQEDKLPVDDANMQKPAIDAERIIRSQLSGLFTTTVMSGWDSPANTPDLIRSIAGRLTAAYLYRAIYSEEGTSVPEYATELYNEALMMLNSVVSGNLTVVDSGGNPIDTTGTNLLGFAPNDNAPQFTMDQVFS